MSMKALVTGCLGFIGKWRAMLIKKEMAKAGIY